LEQRPERRAKEKEKRKQKMQQMALIKGFTESRSASRKRLKHDQGTTVSVCLSVEREDAEILLYKDNNQNYDYFCTVPAITDSVADPGMFIPDPGSERFPGSHPP
jgi:hypothetical protein